jgi:hypothetical protein
MPATYEPIATTTLTSNSATIDFSSIPATYTDLVLVFPAKSSPGGSDAWIMVNGDTASNYGYRGMFGDGGVSGAFQTATVAIGLLTDYYGVPQATDGHVAIAIFNNYANTITHKTMISRANHAVSGTDMNVCTWRSTAAINRLTLKFNASPVYATGSTATLYGIKAA